MMGDDGSGVVLGRGEDYLAEHEGLRPEQHVSIPSMRSAQRAAKRKKDEANW
jgi:hypothetical protein